MSTPLPHWPSFLALVIYHIINSFSFRQSKNLICIEDPFDTNWDVSKVYKNDKWKRCCIFTEKVIANWLVNQNRANLLDIFAPIPKSEFIESLLPYEAKNRRTIYTEKKKEKKKWKKEKREKEIDVVLNTKILNSKFKSLSIKDQIKPTASTTGNFKFDSFINFGSMVHAYICTRFQISMWNSKIFCPLLLN